MNTQIATDKKESLYKYVKDYYWSIFRSNTAILSSTCRQLALGLGSISWLAKSNPSYAQFTCQANTILIVLVFFFIFDAAQYLIQSISFHNLAKDYDNKIKAGEITVVSQLIERPRMNIATNVLFGIKLVLLACAAGFFISLIFKV